MADFEEGRFWRIVVVGGVGLLFFFFFGLNFEQIGPSTLFSSIPPWAEAPLNFSWIWQAKRPFFAFWILGNTSIR